MAKFFPLVQLIKSFPVTGSYLGSREHAHKLHHKLVGTNKYSRYTVIYNEVQMIKNTAQRSTGRYDVELKK